MGHGFINLGRNTTFVTKKEMAWHGLGIVVDAMTSKEAIILGGLDFKVGLKKLYTVQDGIDMEPTNRRSYIDKEALTSLSNNYATYRTDNEDIFGVVGSRYEPIQNRDAFEFFDSVIGEGHAQYETVGALGNGERVFITAKLPDSMQVKRDAIEKYLLLSMAHDGSGAIVVMFTPVRVVCNNTLSMALNGKNKVSIRHTKNALHRLEKAKQILGIANRKFTTMEDYFNHLTKFNVSDEDASNFFKYAFNLKPQENGRLSTRSNNKLWSLKQYYGEGPGQEDIQGTAWGVFNGVTGFLQNVEKRNDEVQFNRTFIKGDEDIRLRFAEAFTLFEKHGAEELKSLVL